MTARSKNEKPAPVITGPFTRHTSPPDTMAQRDANRECQHPPTPCLRHDEPMHPYGLD